jgi:hypothetical protein
LTMLPVITYLFSQLINPAWNQALGTYSVELASKSFSLEERYENPYVNGVFKDNILLTLNYMAGTVDDKNDIVWEEITKPYRYEFVLNPGEIFAFHDTLLPEYKDTVVKTTNAHFNFTDGFKSDGWLYGDGVCHLASLIHWAAIDAGLESISLASHDFARIPGISREYGVSIRYMPGEAANSARQNLYVRNSLDKSVTFAFDYDGDNLTVEILASKVN